MKYLSSRPYLYLLLVVFCMLSFCSCEKELETPAPFLSVGEKSLNFDQTGADYTLEVRCNEEYAVKTIDGLERWCTVSKLENGNLQLNVAFSEEKNVRRGRLCIAAKSQADTISVAQLGWGKAILVSQSVFNVEESGNKLSVDVTANVVYTLDAGECTWIEQQASTRGGL